MQQLKELVLFIDKHYGKKINLVREKKLSKLQRLYDGVLNNAWNNDEAAMEELYLKEGEASSAYRKLKMTLKHKLIDLVFTIDLKHSDATDRQKASYICYKDWAAVKLLLAKNARANGIELCLKVLKEATKHEFTDLCRDASAILRIHYGTMEGDERKFHYYNKLYKKYNYLCQQEELAEEYYTHITMQYVNIRKVAASIHENAIVYYQELEPILQQYNSYRLHLYGRLIQMSIFSSINDYENTLKVCKSAIDFFKQKAYIASAPLQIFYYQMLVNYITTKEFEKGIDIAKELDHYIEPGIFNWFKYQELCFLLFTHTKRYEQAYQVFQTVSDNNRFQFLPAHVTETWKIFEAYLALLVKTKVLLNTGQHTLKFKPGKFLNEISLFSKDKGGMNVAVLIIQLVFSILEQEEGDAAEQVDAINKYCTRHLTQESNRRSYCFIKLLLQIPQHHFNYHTIVKKTEPLLKELELLPFEVSSQSLEVEIIPFETLWELVFRALNTRSVAVGYRATN